MLELLSVAFASSLHLSCLTSLSYAHKRCTPDQPQLVGDVYVY